MIPRILPILFPQTCLGCGREGHAACEDCLSLIDLSRNPSPLPATTNLSGLLCATSYEDYLVQRLIHAFKYQPFIKTLAKPLAFLIVSHFTLSNNFIYPPNIIIPIPLHKRRLKWRGYNHAEELAKQLGYAFSLPVIPQALGKVKRTRPQTKLNRAQRLKNMKGVFAVQHPELVQDKNILLVDDVFTTGATMEECARVLKKAGAYAVYGACVARD